MNISDAIPLKIVVVGDSKVGKTTLIHTYLKETLGKLSAQKIQLDYQIIQVNILQKQYCVAIWDSVGQEFQNQMHNFIIRDADAIMLCIDLSKQINIQSINSWMDSLLNRCPQHCQFVLIGTKQDLYSYNTQQLNEIFYQLKDKYQVLKQLIQVSFNHENSIKQAFQRTFELGAEAIQDNQSILNFQSFFLQKSDNPSVLRKSQGRTSDLIMSSGRKSDIKKKEEQKCC